MPDKEIMVQIREREEQRPWRSLDALTDDPRTVPGLINALGSLVDDWRATAGLYEKAKLKGAMTAYVVPLRHAAAELDKVIKGLEQPRRAPLGQLQQPEAPAPHESAGLDEPVHRFTPGEGGRCGATVARDGDMEYCDRYASHPAHRMQTPAADLASLESLVADSVAKHKQLDAEGVPDFRGPGDLADPNAGQPTLEGLLAAPTLARMGVPASLLPTGEVMIPDPGVLAGQEPGTFPGQASGDEVAAYLRGETDDLPGEPLRPSSVRDQTAPEQVGVWRTLVTGSRTWDDADTIREALNSRLGDGDPAGLVVVHGACPTGADAIAAAWCRDSGVTEEPHPADWNGPAGKGAGFARNQAMVDSKPDEALAFIRDGSKGATHCADAAERAGIPTSRFTYDERSAPVEIRPGVFTMNSSHPPIDIKEGALTLPPIDGDRWAMATARETLETTTVTIPPVPLLGQPGNAGAGYDHAYVPPGGVPATYAELLTPVPRAALPAHISHSQIGTAGECGVKYRLQRLPRDERVDQRLAPVEQIPQWANIGGSAFHAAIEDIERGVLATSPEVLNATPPETLWEQHFGAEIAKIEATSPVPRSRWRASKQGAEGETWWNANGPLMIERYLKARPAEPTAGMPRQPQDQWGALEDAIELERTVAVQTPYGPIAYRAVIDRITVRPPEHGDSDVTLIIRDYKSGDRMPDSTQQLGEYAQVLRLLGVPPSVRILGSYFNARKGTWTPEVDLEAAGWTAEWFAYHVASGHAERLKLTAGPTPARPSSFCGGCSVRWACPVKNGARR